MPWSNAAQDDYVLLLRNGIETNVQGVQSETAEDVEQYDGETYRDELDATFLGTARNTLIGGSSDALIPNGSTTNVVGPSGLTYDTVQDPLMEQSDSFTHTEPRPLKSTRTRLLWWSAASGGGNVVSWAWADQVVSFSPSAYIRI